MKMNNLPPPSNSNNNNNSNSNSNSNNNNNDRNSNSNSSSNSNKKIKMKMKMKMKMKIGTLGRRVQDYLFSKIETRKKFIANIASIAPATVIAACGSPQLYYVATAFAGSFVSL